MAKVYCVANAMLNFMATIILYSMANVILYFMENIILCIFSGNNYLILWQVLSYIF